MEISRHNAQVKKNRHIIPYLINDFRNFLAKKEKERKKEIVFCEHDITDSSQIKGYYVELLNYAFEYDAQEEEHLKTPRVF